MRIPVNFATNAACLLALTLPPANHANAAEPAWSELASMSTPRSAMSAAALGPLIYVPGGLGTTRAVESYDTAANAWRPLALLPAGRHHHATAAYDNRIYVFSGGDQAWHPTSTAWVYNPRVDRWTSITDLPEPRFAAAAVTLGDHIYVVGGNGPTGQVLRYDPKRDSWARLARLKDRRENNAAAVLDGKIYAIAGRWDPGGALASVEVYDPKTDSWSSAPALRSPRGGHAAVTVGDKIYVLGGEMGESQQTLDQVETLAAGDNAWVPAAKLPRALHGLAAAAVENRLYVLGGSDRTGAVVNGGRVFRLNP